MKDLTEKIANITKIPIKYQEIEFRGESLPDTYQPLISIEQFEELVVVSETFIFKKVHFSKLEHSNFRNTLFWINGRDFKKPTNKSMI